MKYKKVILVGKLELEPSS